MANFEIVSQHYPVQTENNHDKHHGNWYKSLDMNLRSTKDDSAMATARPRATYIPTDKPLKTLIALSGW